MPAWPMDVARMTPSGYDRAVPATGTFAPSPTVSGHVLPGSVRGMAEFISVTTSSYDPAALAVKLTEKSAEGWSVVSIVASGGEIVAYLTRGGSTAPAAAAAAVSPEPRAVATTSGPSPVAEPAGWGAAPAAAQTTSPYAPSPQPASASTTTTTASPVSAAGATPAA